MSAENRIPSTRTGAHRLLGLAAALALALLPPVSPAVAQDEGGDSQVGAPIVGQRVAPQVLDMNMRVLGLTSPMRAWREGDPIRVVEDLKQAGEEDAPGGASFRRSDPPDEQTGDVSAMEEAEPFAGDEPLRVMPDLREDAGAAPVVAGAAAPIDVLSFDAIPATGSLPPDTVGDVGPDHYVQMVNSVFSIYDKQGNLLAGPTPINSLWAGFGGPCQTQNNGDPVVRYDHLADRWLLSQFALPANGQHHECIAISRGPNPVTDGYFLYAFPTQDASGNFVFPDYPKIGVWPDGYYMGTQRGFPGGGLDVWAFERDQMLIGAPAGMVQFPVAAPSLFLLPSDLDGPAPAAGTPNFFVRQVDGQRFGGADRVEIFAFSVNWNNPGASTFLQIAVLPAQAFDSMMCGGGLLDACVRQPGTNVRLETLTVWPMFRAQYRTHADDGYDTVVFNHTVDADGQGRAGVRWYELRRTGNNWAIFQQGTHSPDPVERWMGSAAMDGDGNIAVGYSVSSRTVFPGVRYALRTPGDPPGTLPFEGTIVDGAGSQTFAGAPRWGNYSSLDVDPEDDCTFWFTTEYYASTSQAGWRTRVGAFRESTCGTGGAPMSQYAAKVVCGIQKDPEELRLARGAYATTVNIHNPQREKVSFFKKLALTFPPKEQRPGKIVPIANDALGPDEALKVDCEELRRLLNGFPEPYIEGFVVIESQASLDVTAVYTTAILDREGRVTAHSSIDVEQIAERTMRVPPGDGPGNGGECADLVVRDIGPPDVNCPTGGGSCVTKVDVTIANVGAGNAGPFTTRVELDPNQTVDRASPGGLGAGASDSFTATTSPGGNCFNPDCTICVTVDHQQQVEECDESNNRKCETSLG